MEIRHYVNRQGTDVFQRWLDALGDLKARVVILRRIDRLQSNNFGDCKACGGGVWELRIDFGPGYRIYYARAGRAVMLLLGGGSKRTQASDIKRAVLDWADFREREQ